ncbi:MAG: hypothetical protein ACOC1F_01315 [Myxococcota bacterium]
MADDGPRAAAVAIGSVRPGEVCTVAGTIRLAGGALLTSPLGQRPCVYWEVNRAVGDEQPERFEARDFWIEDATGRALVRAERIQVDARAERRKQAIEEIDADVHDVSERLRALKKERKSASGREASRLAKEQRRLKKLATLLCAIRAHARGNIHVGGTKKGQEKYIRERSAALGQPGQGEGMRALALMGERFEVVLSEGAHIEVVGLCEQGPVPAGVQVAGGYRDAPTCLHIRAPDGGELMLLGLGADAPVHMEAGGLDASSDDHARDEKRQMAVWHGLALLVVAVGLAVAWLAYRG